MKINRLETHDRLLHLKKDQSEVITKGAEDCLFRNPLSLAIQEKCPYVYIFGHPRTADDGVNKRMLWQPRLSKPAAQSNSYLFRAISKTDQMEICWMIPDETLWDQYKKGNVTQHEIAIWSIEQFKFNKAGLEEKDLKDLSEDQCKFIMRGIIGEHIQDLRMKKMYAKPEILVPSLYSSLESA